MKFYLTESGEYLRTQAEAKQSGEPFEQVEVPTDARGLVAYLNSLRAEPKPEKVDTSTPYERKNGAMRVVSEVADGLTTNDVVELIMTCKSGVTLGRYAMAVSMRYDSIHKRSKR